MRTGCFGYLVSSVRAINFGHKLIGTPCNSLKLKQKRREGDSFRLPDNELRKLQIQRCQRSQGCHNCQGALPQKTLNISAVADLANLRPPPGENKCCIRTHVEFNTVDGLMTIAERASSWRLTRMDPATMARGPDQATG